VKVNKFSGKCFNCGKNVHISRFCKSKRKQNIANDVKDAMIAIACKKVLMNNNKMWVMDIDATKHMCTEQKAFTNLNKDRQSIVCTTAKYSTKSIGACEVILNTRLNKYEKNPVELKDTLCVPGLRNNLLSVANLQITDILKRLGNIMRRLIGPTARLLLPRQNITICTL